MNSAVFTHTPAIFTFPAGALNPVAEVPDLVPSVRTQGSELDFDPAPGVNVWCLDEELGPAPGDPELLSAWNAVLHSAPVSGKSGSDFQEEVWIPVDTNPGPLETDN